MFTVSRLESLINSPKSNEIRFTLSRERSVSVLYRPIPRKFLVRLPRARIKLVIYGALLAGVTCALELVAVCRLFHVALLIRRHRKFADVLSTVHSRLYDEVLGGIG
jgi:hypothetical protein